MTKQYKPKLNSVAPLDLAKICEIDLIYRPEIPVCDRPHVNTSVHAHAVFRENWNDMTIGLYEEFKVMYLNNSNRCLGILTASKGSITGTLADTRLVFGAALKAAATSIIVAHNHPSGNLKISQSDRALTRKLSLAGESLDIKVLDHLILTPDHYLSFADEKIMP
jgi:DNA repair protein RadC